ncbi:hypothetical protein [Rhodococcus sp. SGAir0479]|uniref:hypothetical protein n=1 Tax=Rhodococcus sp. SGAir0479 TaxID=2567884 RepID=UPI0010CD5EDE|nr:hypothetical protein [Rhodococcus sp. SGAir0479]QCQ89834.1 hypothetical protein E7742_00470 [Rhodococcus sp. SGAir0479]
MWVCAGVGVHFLPSARLFDDLGLVPLGAAVTTVAAAAPLLGLVTDVAPGTVTGVGAGIFLAVAALAVLARPRNRIAPSRLPEHC